MNLHSYILTRKYSHKKDVLYWHLFSHTKKLGYIYKATRKPRSPLLFVGAVGAANRRWTAVAIVAIVTTTTISKDSAVRFNCPIPHIFCHIIYVIYCICFYWTCCYWLISICTCSRRRRTRVDRSDMTVLLKTMCCGMKCGFLFWV